APKPIPERTRRSRRESMAAKARGRQNPARDQATRLGARWESAATKKPAVFYPVREPSSAKPPKSARNFADRQSACVLWWSEKNGALHGKISSYGQDASRPKRHSGGLRSVGVRHGSIFDHVAGLLNPEAVGDSFRGVHEEAEVAVDGDELP